MKKKRKEPPPLREQIREVRLDLGLTHPQVAEQCGWMPEFGVMLESGARKLNVEHLVKLAHALGARVGYEPGKGWTFRRRRKGK